MLRIIKSLDDIEANDVILFKGECYLGNKIDLLRLYTNITETLFIVDNAIILELNDNIYVIAELENKEIIIRSVQIGFGSYSPLYRGLSEILINTFICPNLIKNEKFIKNVKILINEQNEK